MSERAEADTVAVRVSEGIAWVKFNRPEKRNCMSPKLNRQMLRVINDLEFRDDLGVLVLTLPGEHQHAQVVAKFEVIDDAQHLPVELRAHAVALLRAIELHPGDSLADAHGNGIGFSSFAHGGLYCYTL